MFPAGGDGPCMGTWVGAGLWEGAGVGGTAKEGMKEWERERKAGAKIGRAAGDCGRHIEQSWYARGPSHRPATGHLQARHEPMAAENTGEHGSISTEEYSPVVRGCGPSDQGTFGGVVLPALRYPYTLTLPCTWVYPTLRCPYTMLSP